MHRLSILLTFLTFFISFVSPSPHLSDEGWPWPWPRRPRTTTIVDLLSTSEEFSPLIKILQRTALIPTLNSSENVTLVAPIAEAMEGFEEDITRELMMYHILNGSLLSTSMETDEIVMESILKMTSEEGAKGIGVKIRREGDRGRGQGKLRIADTARVVKSDWEANNGTCMRMLRKLT
jgi:uncharacterized surface protein with fasciclin (FAS1) repeats